MSGGATEPLVRELTGRQVKRVRMDFHRKPFDDATSAKLALFADYTRAWLPVFLHRPGERLTIADLFAGPGRDLAGADGSPLVILREIRKYTGLIRSSGVRVHFQLNERAPRKARVLREVMEAQQIPGDLCTWDVTSHDFSIAFESLLPRLNSSSNLIFLDQQGMKFISDRTFKCLVGLPTTDFMFFIASSSLRRFADQPSFARYVNIPKGRITARAFDDTHRAVTEHYRGLLEDSSSWHLAPFSMKKGSNLYGVIFGTSHYLGLEKFLRVCWSIDSERGEANFDIDDDRLEPHVRHLWSYMDRPQKVNTFQRDLETDLLGRRLKTDGEVYLACLHRGMLPHHGREVLCRLVRERLIRVAGDKRCRVSKEAYSDPRELEVLT